MYKVQKLRACRICRACRARRRNLSWSHGCNQVEIDGSRENLNPVLLSDVLRDPQQVAIVQQQRRERRCAARSCQCLTDLARNGCDQNLAEG